MTGPEVITCQHCGARLENRGGTWCDAETGIAGCIKGELKVPAYPGEPGGAIAREAVPHKPMPRIHGAAS